MDKVTLVGPDGHEVVAETAVALNNYLYGHGYKPKGKKVETVVAKAIHESGDGK